MFASAHRVHIVCKLARSAPAELRACWTCAVDCVVASGNCRHLRWRAQQGKAFVEAAFGQSAPVLRRIRDEGGFRWHSRSFLLWSRARLDLAMSFYRRFSPLTVDGQVLVRELPFDSSPKIGQELIGGTGELVGMCCLAIATVIIRDF